MSTYGVTLHGFWEGPTGVALAAAGVHAQVVAHYLMSCRDANMIGLYHLSLPVALRQVGSLTHDLLVDAMVALDEHQFAHYDLETRIVWVRNMAFYRLGLWKTCAKPVDAKAGDRPSAVKRPSTEIYSLQQSDKRVTHVNRLYSSAPPNPFLLDFWQQYREVLRLEKRRTYRGARKPLVSPFQGATKPVFSVQGFKDQDRTEDQEQARLRRLLLAADEPADNPKFLVRLAHDVLDQVARGMVHPLDAKDNLKTRAAQARVRYDAEAIRLALDVAERQRALSHQGANDR